MPFSEPETEAIKELCVSNTLNTEGFDIALNYHSFSDVLIQPYVHDDSETPDDNIFNLYSDIITLDNRYVYGKVSELIGYNAFGAADDWMYGEQNEKPKIISMTPEVGNPFDGFWPDSDRIIPLQEENLTANIYLAYSAGTKLEISLVEVNDLLLNNNAFPDAGENLELIFHLKNNGLSEGLNSIQATLTSDDPYIENTNPFSSYGSISSIYESEEINNSTNPFNAFIEEDAPVGHSIKINLELQNDVTGYYSKEDYTLVVGKPYIIFSEDGEDIDFFSINWFNDNDHWGLESPGYEGNYAINDNPYGGIILDGSLHRLTTINGINLSNNETAKLLFNFKYNIENSSYGQLQASSDGINWTPLWGRWSEEGSDVGIHNENQPEYYNHFGYWLNSPDNWVLEYYNLSAYANGDCYLSFLINTSSSGSYEFPLSYGLLIDNLKVISYLLQGDLNKDNEINILDVVTLVNVILEVIVETDYELVAGDFSNDGMLAINDVIILVNIILNNNLARGSATDSNPVIISHSLNSGNSNSLERSETNAIEIEVYTDQVLGGVQLDVEFDSELFFIDTILTTSFTDHMDLKYNVVDDGIVRFIIYSEEGLTFGPGDDIIAIIYLEEIGLGRNADNESISLGNIYISSQNGEIIVAIFEGGNNTSTLPTEFVLLNNYPNPFNPKTTIKYEVPELDKENHVSIIIYNAMGQQVKELVNSNHEPGYYEVSWNGKNNYGISMPTGFYIYKLVSNQTSISNKMILLK